MGVGRKSSVVAIMLYNFLFSWPSPCSIMTIDCPLFQFKFADGWDIYYMLVGIIFAIGNGIGQPLSIILFGDLIQDFIQFGNAQIIAKSTNTTVKPPDIEGQMTKFALYYTFIGIGSLFAAYVHTAYWSLAGVRQANRIRTRCFNCIIRQDIGWFDVTDPGELSSRITE